jgi:hypothetical protein
MAASGGIEPPTRGFSGAEMGNVNVALYFDVNHS